ncbi:hypothetical protein BGZ99_005174 [Dissophora globulifera]|uniref:Uncharacterized protein n=1 Tax=Dissophora globulifera TaxID=979702 RepID=A0A9P6RSZ7_9FUNG|nr:hypothetical protein BGZ99_005174 [Dissophora globulifera]
MRPPSAAAVRSSTFHGMESVSALSPTQNGEHSMSSSYGGSLAGIAAGMGALSIQPINISEEKLPPFGHSAAHLRMINALPESASSISTHDQPRGSPISSDKDGPSPGLSVNGDPTFGSLHGTQLVNHASSLSSSTASSVASLSAANPLTTAGNASAAASVPGPGVTMARPGLRTVGSSENFAWRVRSGSMLRRNEEQEVFSKGGFQPSRPPHSVNSFSGQQVQQPTLPQGHYHQHPGYQQQQYSYTQESGSSDMHRYRRASSPRRRSISMTNLNGGLSMIMIPSKKVCEDNG